MKSYTADGNKENGPYHGKQYKTPCGKHWPIGLYHFISHFFKILHSFQLFYLIKCTDSINIVCMVCCVQCVVCGMVFQVALVVSGVSPQTIFDAKSNTPANQNERGIDLHF